MKPGSARLLLVDDDANNLDMLSRRLGRLGYSVDVAQDGPAALEKLAQAHYDLVLLDQMMPGMSGLDLLRLLRATRSPSELPVIMVTAVDQSQTVLEALDKGANDYVVKPVDMPVITARIEAQLSGSKEERDPEFSDPLTGLGNRRALIRRLAAVLPGGREGAVTPALLLLDLHGFKIVNSSFGHAAGDQILIEVAGRLAALFTAGGIGGATVVRTGGDEFAVLLETFGGTDELPELMEAVLKSINHPVSVQGLSISIGVNLGLVTAGPEHTSPEVLLRDANLALCRARELGTNRWQRFDVSLRQQAQQQVSTADGLRGAAERNELVAFYQPKFALATRRIVGFEALLRWRHPERGLLCPPDFISVAEETGLIIPVGAWILETACRQLKSWQAKYPLFPPLTMNVNLSVKQLTDPGLVERVKKILQETSILPGTLRLELTESCLMSEIASAEEVLADLKALQVGLKLDDSGTGYPLLSCLRTVHFDSLRIDRSFVKRLPADPECAAIVETIVKLAHTLRMNVTAEGIENEHQLNHLRGAGCEIGQGFYFSPPLGTDAAERLMDANLGRGITPVAV